MPGSRWDAEQVGIGTVPNQSELDLYGGWCPGMEVPVWREDMTNEVNLNGENTINYLGMMKGQIYRPTYTDGNFYPNINMRSYVVYYQ